MLSLVIADALFKRYPSQKEGKLSVLRAELVKGETLAIIAKEHALGALIKLGAGEIKTGGAERTSILANALEALLGAVFWDGGFEAATRVILNMYHTRLEQNAMLTTKDAKTELQEHLHAHKIPLARYSLIQTEGAQHAQQFHVLCSVDSLRLSEKGQGKTRRSAEQAAALALLSQLEKNKSKQ